MIRSTMQGKVALVTGGGTGIGRASALAFARAGASVVIANRSREAGEETARLLDKAGGKARFVQTDVTKPQDVERMVGATLDAFGGLHFAFNNAGIEGDIAFTADSTEENWRRVLDVNLLGAWRCMQHEIRHMVASGGGAIVNCSSIAGLVGTRGLAPYVASKHALLGLTKTAALEYAEAHVRVNAVCPGPIDTPMLDRIIGERAEFRTQIEQTEPVRRIGRPEEVAGAAVWLCSDEASFVTGQALAIDGGWVAQ